MTWLVGTCVALGLTAMALGSLALSQLLAPRRAHEARVGDPSGA